MLFGEMFVAIAAILAGCWMIASIGKHTIKWLSGEYSRKESAGAQLTTSELEVLVRRAVEEAAAPLEAKIERLERRVEEKIPRPLAPPEDVHRFGLLADTDTLREEPERHA